MQHDKDFINCDYKDRCLSPYYFYCRNCTRNKSIRFTNTNNKVRDNYKCKWWNTKLGGI